MTEVTAIEMSRNTRLSRHGNVPEIGHLKKGFGDDVMYITVWIIRLWPIGWFGRTHGKECRFPPDVRFDELMRRHAPTPDER